MWANPEKNEIQCPVRRGYCAWMVVAGQSNRPTSIPTISKKYKQDCIHEKTPSRNRPCIGESGKKT